MNAAGGILLRLLGSALAPALLLRLAR